MKKSAQLAIEKKHNAQLYAEVGKLREHLRQIIQRDSGRISFLKPEKEGGRELVTSSSSSRK